MERAVSVNTRDRRDTCRGKVARPERATQLERDAQTKVRAARVPATPETHDPSTSARMSMLSRVSSTRLRDDPPDPTPPQPLLPLPSLDPHSPAPSRPTGTAPPRASEQRVDPPSTVRSLSLRVSVTDVGGGEKLQTLNETPNTHNAHTHINTHIKHAHTHGTH